MENLIETYKRMFFIREMESQLVDYYLKNKVFSMVHFYIGQEAVAVGVCDSLEPQDFVFGNHRSHGHYLARGGNPQKMVQELLGKADGCSKGKGGSMHLIDKSANFRGTTSILGSIVPIASGGALFKKHVNDGGISVAFIGDGASEEGAFYETINLAGLYKIPLMIIVENNLYSVQTKLNERRSKYYNLRNIVEGLGGIYIEADGLDYFDVKGKTAQGRYEMVECGKVPVVIECKTFRHMAHSTPLMDDKSGYRIEDPLDVRDMKDSVKSFRRYLVSTGTSDETLQSIQDSVKIEISNIISSAEKSDNPNKHELYTNIYES